MSVNDVAATIEDERELGEPFAMLKKEMDVLAKSGRPTLVAAAQEVLQHAERLHNGTVEILRLRREFLEARRGGRARSS